MSTNDFYVVLPSNASPLTHPKNTASDYITSFDTPIRLDPNENWKVALTEISYIYKPHTITTNLGIEFDRCSDIEFSFEETISVKTHRKGNDTFDISLRNSRNEILPKYPNHYMYRDYEGHNLRITCPFHFKIVKQTGADSFNWPINVLSTDMGNGYTKLVSNTPINQAVPWDQHVTFTLEYKIYHCEHKAVLFTFSEDVTMKSSQKLAKYLKNKCGDVLQNVKYENKRLIFNLGNRISRVKFLGGLNFILGYSDEEYNLKHEPKQTEAGHTKQVIIGDFRPQLNRGINNLYIYASCCSPLHVGHKLVPLLKNVFVDTSKDANNEGHMRNLAIQHPAYVDVANSSISYIEINIRNDAGNIIPFPKGAITVLTLHFKRAGL